MSEAPERIDNTVQQVVVDVDGVQMSALLAAVPQPRAVIVALHGGASTSTYFDYPDQPRSSLLRTGAALGYTVLALDRPGYGRSAPWADRMTTPAERVDLAYAALDRLLEPLTRGAGTFLLAHSIGCELALRIATDERGQDLLGLELAGTGVQHHPEMQAVMAARTWEGTRLTRPKGVRGILWHPSHLYPDGVVGGARITSSGPGYEGGVVETWASREFPALAARVRVPVHFSLGDHERVWRSDPAARAELAALFGASSRVCVHEQADAGHNLSLGLTAMAYHLRVLSFVEECVVNRQQAVDLLSSIDADEAVPELGGR